METIAHERNSLRENLAAEVLRQFGELRFTALGESMLPGIFPHDVLVVRRERFGNIHCGDVVLAARKGRFYAHRVIRKTTDGGRFCLITRGDALTQEDPPVTEDELLGRVTVLLRGRRKMEAAEKLGLQSLLGWGVRHSEAVARWLLRWHSLRKRFVRVSGEASAGTRRSS